MALRRPLISLLIVVSCLAGGVAWFAIEQPWHTLQALWGAGAAPASIAATASGSAPRPPNAERLPTTPRPGARAAGIADARPARASAARAAPRSAAPAALRSTFTAGLAGIGQVTSSVLQAVVLILAIVSAAGGSGAVALLMVRTWHRRGRAMVRYWLVPYRSDEARQEAVMALIEAWHQILLERWWRRPMYGQRGMTLEIVSMDDGQGSLEGRMLLGIPERLVGTFEGALLGCYPDCRLTPLDKPFPVFDSVLRLKKRHPFIRALRTTDITEKRNVVDVVLSQMERTGSPACVQITLVPAPAVFDRWARRRYRRHERSGVQTHSQGGRVASTQSEVVGRELERGLVSQHRTLFFTDVRVAGANFNQCYGIAGTLRGETGGENRLVVRQMRLRAALYRTRVLRALGNPLPGWRRGVFSSSELAALWHMPSPGLTAVSVRRTLVPRAVASPDVTREPAHALMRDENGLVGILPQDKSDGLGLIGGQKTGKTSVLCQSVRVDTVDEDCAVVVLMPKPGDALAALSMVPSYRTVHFLDFERPEFGINPLLANGDVSMVADKIVAAFRDVVAEGDIRGSSDRYLRQSAQATIAAGRAGVLSEPPSLWHMYRMLLPSETAFREHVVDAIYGDPRFVDTATFFGRDLPNDLRDALVNTTSKLDAPRNKILRLLVESLDKVLRHPIQLSIDEVIRNREVLVVDGKMGTFGSDNCRVMMQFILSMLYGALQRQQQLPERERSRVALKVDEAHLIINPSFADALATLRSAGLEVVAAWQYGAQIEDPKIRGGMMSLLRQRCMFSMGESRDAREMSDLAMSVYVDMIRDDPASRGRLRMTPDVFMNLPNHHALCSWISSGARTPAFLGQTVPMNIDERVIAEHLARQRARGGYVPERLPNPFPAVGVAAEREQRALDLVGAPVDADAAGDPVSSLPDLAPPAPVRSANGQHAPARPAVDRLVPLASDEPRPTYGDRDDAVKPSPRSPAREPRAPKREPAPARRLSAPPESYTELDLDGVRGISWDSVELLAADERQTPSGKELEILVALWNYRHLFASQMHRRWWPESTLRACQKTLTRMAGAGWVSRFRFQTSEQGSQQRVYCLTEAGFELAKEHAARGGPRIDAGAVWRPPPSDDMVGVLRDLHVNGWVLAMQQLAGRRIRDWRGPARSKVVPPRRRERGDWVDVRPSEVPIPGGRQLRELGLDRLESVNPAATVELRLRGDDKSVRLDLLVDLDRARGAAYNEVKLRRYDAFLAGWHHMVDRYRDHDAPPVVVFVCEDVRQALAYVKTADRVVTARLARVGDPEDEWPYPSRRQMLFVCERDMHMGSLAALALPELPPDARVKRDGRNGARLQPKRVEIVARSQLATTEEAG